MLLVGFNEWYRNPDKLHFFVFPRASLTTSCGHTVGAVIGAGKSPHKKVSGLAVDEGVSASSLGAMFAQYSLNASAISYGSIHQFVFVIN